jgi:hypothetical protein
MVSIVQCLCPKRHCMLAAAYVPTAERTPAHMKHFLRKKVTEMIALKVANPYCGICGARPETFSYEAGVTRFESMEQALPELRRLEKEQARARAIFQNRN